MNIIDAYAHCGLSKYKPLQDLEGVMQQSKIEKAVLVQHWGEFDNIYIQNIIISQPSRFAGAFLVDNTKKEALDDLHYWSDIGHFRGIRLMLRSLEDNRPLWQEACEIGLNIMVGDPEDTAGRLNLLFDFLEDNPLAKVVLYHIAEPRFNNDPGLKKSKSVFTLKQYPNVYFQISGMHLFSDYPYRILWPFIKFAFESFGPERILWGGNFPVSGEEQGYLREVKLIREHILPIPRDHMHQFVYNNAIKLWFN
jgi:L-fuconolactonase